MNLSVDMIMVVMLFVLIIGICYVLRVYEERGYEAHIRELANEAMANDLSIKELLKVLNSKKSVTFEDIQVVSSLLNTLKETAPTLYSDRILWLKFIDKRRKFELLYR